MTPGRAPSLARIRIMMNLLRTLSFFVVFCLHQLLILPPLVFHTLTERRHSRPWLRPGIHRIAQGWGRLLCRLGGARVHIVDRSGLSSPRTFLIVSNHQGDFDIPLLLAHAPGPLAFVAKKELGHIPLVSAWMRRIGCVFLDREDRRRQVEQIRETVDKLKGGLSMVIFPEGTRSRGPEMRPFAKGSLNIAQRAGVPILPITLTDSYLLLPAKGHGLPGARVTLTLHPPLDPATLSPDENARLHEIVQDIIQRG